jgi:hypothetical protein
MRGIVTPITTVAAPPTPAVSATPSVMFRRRHVRVSHLSEFFVTTWRSVLFIALLLACAGCAEKGPQPNLLLAMDPEVDLSARTINITILNNGQAIAGPHEILVELNSVDAKDNVKPQAQFTLQVPELRTGGSWTSGPLSFSTFTSRGLDLASLSNVNVVVRVDAKDAVKESNEDDNLYNANR